MADDIAVPGLGITVGGDLVSSVFYQRVKPIRGADGTYRSDQAGESLAGGFVSGASNNATVVKNSAGWLHWVYVSNINAAVRYLKFYNKATTPAPASDNALLTLRIAVPPSSLTPQFLVFPQPIYHSSGIGLALITGISDTDNTSVSASEHVVGYGYE